MHRHIASLTSGRFYGRLQSIEDPLFTEATGLFVSMNLTAQSLTQLKVQSQSARSAIPRVSPTVTVSDSCLD